MDERLQKSTRNDTSGSIPTAEKETNPAEGKSLLKPFKCTHCESRYCSRSARSRHLKNIHSIIKGNYPLTECLDCLSTFDSKPSLRRHLQDHHNLDMSPVCLYFKKLDEFLTWKSNVERETSSIYHFKMRSKSDPPVVKFTCARSGKVYHSRNKNSLKDRKDRCSRMGESKKIGMACTAEINAQLFESEVIVKYYPIHYGHGNFITSQLSPEELSAVDELAEKGFNPEKLMEELSSKEKVDVSQFFPIRKRYLNWVKNAYKVEDFNTDLSDLECVSDWVQKCSDMEECPVLFCLQENIATEREKFILVIMTEFQKQIITSASKQVICVDVINRISDAHLITVLVIDELKTAFPAAYCLTNKLNKNVVKQFFSCIKEYAGNISTEYLMTNHNLYFFESWVEVMNNSPQWLWNRWDTEGAIIDHLRVFVKKNPSKRRELFDIFQIMLDCKSKDVVMHLFKNCVDKIQQDEKIKKLGEWAMKRLGSDFEKWVLCFQKEINNSTILSLDVMHHIFFSCGTLGKGRRLYTFLSVLMKVLRHKILDRILNSFDDEKISLAVEAIDFCHVKGLTFPTENIFTLSNNLWMIQLDELNKVYVTKDLDACPDHCNLRCIQCEICVHQFSCSCVHNMIDANLCLHIHAIAYKFLLPNKFQHCSFNKLFQAKANNPNNEKSTSLGPHVINLNSQSVTNFSSLQEPCVTNETDQSADEFFSSQEPCAVSETATDFSSTLEPFTTSETVQSVADISCPSQQFVSSKTVQSTVDFSASQDTHVTKETVQSEVDFFSSQEPCEPFKSFQPYADSSPSQVKNSILTETSTPKAQSAINHQSEVSVSTSVRRHFPQNVTTKLTKEHLFAFFKPEKSKSHSEESSTSNLKRKNESLLVETPLKETNKIPKLSNESTFREKFLEDTTKVPQVNNDSTNISFKVISDNATKAQEITMPIEIPLKKIENKDLALKQTTTLFHILKNQNLTKASLITINKCLSECINIANTQKNEIIEMSPKNLINAVYVIKPQTTILEVIPSQNQS